ncbi:MAG TPA: aminotransferase class I/II-fold pyridoxal phosphate-dependent enzyme [Anaerolineaceae bacterium]|nr:aminotransferase class I/II-fold pyridoxal phosphate-dependent enzyme [Anaerolineaceae bacterium]
MTNNSFIKPSDRIASFKPYYYATLAKKIAQLRENGLDIIKIDMGSPDLPPCEFIIDTLKESAIKANKHGYTPMGGSPEFRRAIAQYYQNRFNVQLEPMTETVGLIGSKEGLFNLTQVIVNPGDYVIVHDPGYPVYAASAKIAGGQIYPLPLLEKNNFLPDLKSIPLEVLLKTKLIWINYPNNPTGAIAPLSFFEEIVEFAKKNKIIVAHDAPYVDVCFDGYIAPSLLQVNGAKDVAIEFNSLSKSYNMAGWRLGMAVGNPDIVNYIHTYKSQMDSSQFEPVIDAGIAALTGDQSWLIERNINYKERRDIVVTGLKEAGFELETPPAAIYVWAKLPKGYQNSMDFCNKLLEDTGVSVTPGIVYGEHGEGYLRVSLGTKTERIHEAISRIKNWVYKS